MAGAGGAVSEERCFKLSIAHSLRERAQIIAELALVDLVNDSNKDILLPRATLRVLEALEKYEEIDAAFTPPQPQSGSIAKDS